MKEMIYIPTREVKLLDAGLYKGIEYLIISYGTHPCAYIKVPRDHKYYGVDYNEVPLYVHGGLTFGDDLAYLNTDIELVINKADYWLGWDYAHAGDFTGYYLTSGSPILMQEKKWTTDEIFKQVIQAIDEFKKL